MLPDGWIERIFLRLHASYGRAWIDLWDGAPIDAVKAQWSDSLTGSTAEQIRLAFDALEREGRRCPPSLPEFAALVRGFRARGSPVLRVTDNRREPPSGGFQTIRDALKRATPKP